MSGSSRREPRVDLVTLDMAGTTVQEHGAVYTALEEAVTRVVGTPRREDVRHWMGADKRLAITGLLASGRREATPDPAVVEEVYRDFRARLETAYRRCPPEPMPGVPEALRTFRDRGIKVALTTGFTRDVAGDLVEILKWDDDVLDALVTVDDVALGRPAPFLIFRAMELTNSVDVRRVLVAGDTVRDLESGVNAGAEFVVGVLTGGHDLFTLGAAAHTHLVAGVGDIPALVV